MKVNSRVVFSIAGTIVLLVAFLFLLPPLDRKGERQRAPLLLGTNVWPGYETLYLARSLEYFDEKAVRLVEFASASQVIRAFRNRNIQIAALTLDEALLLRELGIDVRIILVTDVSHGGDAILAKPDVAGVAGLKGRRVGVEHSALGAYVLTRALESAGLSARDVKAVPLEVDDHEKAFNMGTVDAVVTFEPVRSRILAAGGHQIFDSSEIPGEIVDVVAIHSDVLEEHRDEVTELLEAYFKAHRYFQEQPEAASKLMVDRLKLEPAEIVKAFEGLRLPNLEENIAMLKAPDGQLAESARKLAKIMKEENLLQHEVDLDNLCSSEILISLKTE